MIEAPSRAIQWFGTEEPVAPVRLLKAGPLTAELEGGNLRYVRFDGVEMLRAISFIVRDRNWGTYSPRISGLNISESEHDSHSRQRVPAQRLQDDRGERRMDPAARRHARVC